MISLRLQFLVIRFRGQEQTEKFRLAVFYSEQGGSSCCGNDPVIVINSNSDNSVISFYLLNL